MTAETGDSVVLAIANVPTGKPGVSVKAGRGAVRFQVWPLVLAGTPHRLDVILTSPWPGIHPAPVQDVTVEVKHAKDKTPHKLLDNVSGVLYAGQV